MKDFEYQESGKEVGNVPVSATECFEALTTGQRERVENSTTILTFARGETIIKQGFVATHVLFIEKGLVRLDVINDRKTSTVGLLGREDFVGIVCSFACRNVDFSAIALEETVIHMINMDLFNILIKENGEFALKLIRHMSSKTNSIVHWLSRLSSKNVEGSLALILQEFAKLYNSSRYTLPVTRIGLAALAGCSKESTINVLSRFHQDGIIELHDKDISILDPGRLEMVIRQG